MTPYFATELKLTLTQDNDTNARDGIQQLHVQVIDGYIVLKTARWAIELADIDRLGETLKQALVICEDAKRRMKEGFEATPVECG